MGIIFDLVIFMGIVVGELIGAILLMLTIQFIFYKVFKVNIYKSIFRGLDKLDKYLTSKLG